MIRPASLAAGTGLALVLAAAPALAQRAASTPSSETSATVNAVPPPPPGFPAPLGGDIVFGGQLDTHLQSDFISDPKPRVSVFDDTDLSMFLNYKSWLSLNSDIKLERNRDDNLDSFYPRGSAFLNSEGLTLRQLYLTLRPADGLAVYGGKIHPNFGSAYEQAPGIFYNFGTDYEQDERIGFGTQYELPVRLGPQGSLVDKLGLNSMRLSVETFFLDTTFLSNSLISRPPLDDPAARPYRFARSQFGASNTGSFDSYTAALRGGQAEHGLAWQVSITQEATAMPGGRTEHGQSIGGSYDPGGDGIPLGPRLGVTPFLEYAHFTNFDGIAGLERHYAIAGLSFAYARWNLVVAGGLRNSAGVEPGTDHQENTSLTYEVIPGFQVGGGINFINIAGKESRALSPSLSYSRAF